MAVPGVTRVRVDFAARTADVFTSGARVEPGTLLAALDAAGFPGSRVAEPGATTD